MFIASHEKYGNYDENDFLEKWEQLKTNYSLTIKGEFMNSLMKGYINAITFLMNFLKAFESALEQKKKDADLAKF
ncbi:7592_t:CDS:2, partial [Funneliformis caledonium]